MNQNKRVEPNKAMVQAYFHRCKSHYQKLYGTDSGYSHTLLKLLPQIDKRRLNKMVEDVKEVNPFFSSYLEGKQISRLKEEDVEQFEAAFPVDEDLGKAHWLDFMVIRIGFMMVLEKSEQIYANCFQCQANELRNILERQLNKLNEAGESYRFKFQEIQNISSIIGQKETNLGSFERIPLSHREDSKAIYEVTEWFRSIVKQ